MRLRHWFTPETPDVLGLLCRQVAVTVEGMDAFTDWAGGRLGAAERVRAAEHRGDVAKREVLESLRSAFVTPLEPEDVFALSRGVDRTLNYARDLVDETEAMSSSPDAGVAAMAALLGEAVRHIYAAISLLGKDNDGASEAADAAIKTAQHLDGAYYAGMASLLELEDRHERIARRELCRRCSRIGETVVEVAERILYAVIKQT